MCGRPLRSPSCACAFSTLPEWCLAFAPRGYAGTTSGLRIETGTTQLWNSRRLAPTNDARPIRRVCVVKLLWQTVVRVQHAPLQRWCTRRLGTRRQQRRHRQWRWRGARWEPPGPTAALVRRPLGATPAGASAAGGNTGGGCSGARRGSGLHPGWAPHLLLTLPHIIYVYLSIDRSSIDRYPCLSIYLYIYLSN